VRFVGRIVDIACTDCHSADLFDFADVMKCGELKNWD